jgi:ubiquinone/menaquinone biosynthesis C-methylase UbiE
MSKIVYNRFNIESKLYDESRKFWDFGYGSIEKYAIRKFLRGTTILEVGAGTGRHVTYLAKYGFHVVGVDISIGMARYALSKCKDWSLNNVDIIVADAHHLPFREGCFDSSFCSRSIKFFDKPVYALSEMKRVTKKRGIILLSFETTNGSITKYYLKRIMWRILTSFGVVRYEDKFFMKIKLEPLLKYRIAKVRAFSLREVENMFKSCKLKVAYWGCIFKLNPWFYEYLPPFILNIIKRLLDDKPFREGYLSIIVGVNV